MKTAKQAAKYALSVRSILYGTGVNRTSWSDWGNYGASSTRGRTPPGLALDDFGKGHSSLCRPRKLHFGHLKIDQSFVNSMDTIESVEVVGAPTGLGKALGMPVTAEGVETVGSTKAIISCRHRPAKNLAMIPSRRGRQLSLQPSG
jgi:hypothetical protein